LQKRFNGGGTLLAAYTWSKLLSNTDTITSWLETGGTGGIQDWNNLRGEKSPSDGFGSSNFGVISGQGQLKLPRLVQFAGKIVF
jgi:hypothetical protein